MKPASLRLLVIVLFASASAFARSNPADPRLDLDPAIPTPAAVLGYELGTTFTRHHEIIDYARQLTAASNRLRLERIGTTHERRGLYLLTVSSPANLARLTEIRESIAKLADPRRSADEREAERFIAQTPVVVWLNFGIHGDESASPEAAMLVAYHLAAGQDSLTHAILENCFVLLNLCHNPDSHERFVAWYNAVKVGPHGTADPNAAEHHDPWGMNTVGNHYQIDLNRDWFIASQIETQAVLAAYLKWQPQVLVDHHGETNNYFFGPQANPINTNIPSQVRRWFETFAQANAQAFDRHGWSYYGNEDFDEFYPGYSSAWACLNGAVGMTYETDGGGDRGLQVERWDDGTIVTLRDGIDHHFTAAMTTLATAAQRREQRLRDFYDSKRSAIDEGKRSAIKRFLLVEGEDPLRCRQLVQILQRQGIEVLQASQPFRLSGVRDYFQQSYANREFPAGTFIIDSAQPQQRLLTAILEAEPHLDRADTLVQSGEWDEPYYDMTAWALPFSFNLEAYWSDDGRAVPARQFTAAPAMAVSEDSVRMRITGGRASYAYVFDYRSNAAAKLLARLLENDYVVMMAQAPFRLSGRDFARGAIIVRVERNRKELHADMTQWSRACEVEVHAANTGWTESGIKLGSPRMQHLIKPRIAVATGPPTNTPEYGAIWYLLENEYEIEFTAIQMQEIKDADLQRYNVIVFPDDEERWAQPRGRYRENLGEQGVDRIRRWIEAGGTFVGIRGGAIFAISDDSLFAARSAKLCKIGIKGQLARTPGTIFRAQPNTQQLLTAGFEAPLPVLMRNSIVLSASPAATQVFGFDPKADRLKLSGVSSEQDLQLCAGAAYVLTEPVGRGRVILFADDPTFRAAWRGLDRVFLNALLLGPSL